MHSEIHVEGMGLKMERCVNRSPNTLPSFESLGESDKIAYESWVLCKTSE